MTDRPTCLWLCDWQMAFWGSRSRMWQPDSFWERQPGDTTLVHVMAPLPPVSPAAAAAAAVTTVRSSIAVQLAHNPVGTVSVLAHRSARRLWSSPLLNPKPGRHCLGIGTLLCMPLVVTIFLPPSALSHHLSVSCGHHPPAILKPKNYTLISQTLVATILLS